MSVIYKNIEIIKAEIVSITESYKDVQKKTGKVYMVSLNCIIKKTGHNVSEKPYKVILIHKKNKKRKNGNWKLFDCYHQFGNRYCGFCKGWTSGNIRQECEQFEKMNDEERFGIANVLVQSKFLRLPLLFEVENTKK